jgi:phosphoadenosine phosphosulfate reductase
MDKRSKGARMTCVTTDLEELAMRAGDDLEGAHPLEILNWAVEQFGSSWCVASSMADAVLPHLASRVLPGVDVLFLDTGYHFAETIGTRDAVAATMPVTVRTIKPAQTVAEQDAAYGPRLFSRDPDLCCALRKVAPLEQSLQGMDAWITGIRRSQSSTRAAARKLQLDARRGVVKVQPLVDWSDADCWRFIMENRIPYNPLHDRGFPSIGCRPCTSAVAVGEDERAGRWAGRDKTECGLHSV